FFYTHSAPSALYPLSLHDALPIYPQSDGMVERMNRTLLNSLSAFVSDHQRDWDLCTPLVLLAYRTAVHEATKVTPCEAMLGRTRSEEHTSELQSRSDLVCRLLLEK